MYQLGSVSASLILMLLLMIGPIALGDDRQDSLRIREQTALGYKPLPNIEEMTGQLKREAFVKTLLRRIEQLNQDNPVRTANSETTSESPVNGMLFGAETIPTLAEEARISKYDLSGAMIPLADAKILSKAELEAFNKETAPRSALSPEEMRLRELNLSLDDLERKNIEILKEFCPQHRPEWWIKRDDCMPIGFKAGVCECSRIRREKAFSLLQQEAGFIVVKTSVAQKYKGQIKVLSAK